MNRTKIASVVACAGLVLVAAAKLAVVPGAVRATAINEPAGVARVSPAPIAPVPTPNPAPLVKTVIDDRFSETRGREGYWRIARAKDGVWWFLSPQNQTEFLNGVTTVQPSLASLEANGPAYQSSDWDCLPTSLTKWAKLTVGRVEAIGFKSLGAWCNPTLHQFSLPMTRDLNVCRWVPYDARLFSADWERGAEVAIREQASPLRDNRNLIGYYIDNELNWDKSAMNPRLFYDDLSPHDPNRQEVFGFIKHTWPTIEAFNHDWKTTLSGWAQLEQNARLPEAPGAVQDRFETRWLTHVSEAYFRITTSLIRKYDSNHLILGCRYRGWVPAEVPLGARKYTDAQSLNYYASDAMLDYQTFRTITEQAQQPLIISEYSFHALDGRSGNRNRARFPGEVANQEARAAGYRLMTQRLAQVPYVIGADWFQWMDEPPAGRALDGEDANLGVVDLHDKPYETLIEAVRETTPLLDGLHAHSAKAGNQMVWRNPPPGSHHPTAFAGGQDLLQQ
ncbi:MAG TPA: hypothetical protein VIM11_04460 [Tepidisphaeraceae bacterium]|jgi:hypothetical protein